MPCETILQMEGLVSGAVTQTQRRICLESQHRFGELHRQLVELYRSTDSDHACYSQLSILPVGIREMV